MTTEERFIATCLVADPRGHLSEADLIKAATIQGIPDAALTQVKTCVTKLVYTTKLKQRGKGWSGVRLTKDALNDPDADTASSEPPSGGMSAEETDAQLAQYEGELW